MPYLQVEKFVEEECIPADTVYHTQLGEGEQRWQGHPSIIDDLKDRARKLGLWNLFLPRNHFKEGAGFSNLEYGLMAEWLGKSRVASEVCLYCFWRRGWSRRGLRMMEYGDADRRIGNQLRGAGHWEYGGSGEILH